MTALPKGRPRESDRAWRRALDRRFGILLILFGSTACGGRSELFERASEIGPACEPAEPCGGDLVGRWEARDVCADLSHVSLLSDCEVSRFSRVAPSITGFRHYAADGNYEVVLNYGGSVELAWRAECAASPHGGCEGFGRALLSRGRSFLDHAMCRPQANDCECELSLTRFEWRRTGQWRAASGRVFESPDHESDYCVVGRTLRLTSIAGLGGLETATFGQR